MSHRPRRARPTRSIPCWRVVTSGVRPSPRDRRMRLMCVTPAPLSLPVAEFNVLEVDVERVTESTGVIEISPSHGVAKVGCSRRKRAVPEE